MASGCVLLCLAGTAFGHVPYLENADFSAEAPFPVRNVAQSKAFYAHLEGAGDIDYYALEVDQATRVYMHVNIPWCREYEEFTVNYALVGPGLPPPEANLPFPVPAGQGVVVVRENFASPADRLVGFERFAGRMYFEGPVRQVDVSAPGNYLMVVWNEAGQVGDYVAVIGREEQFGPMDIWRALTITPRLRRGDELHVSCEAPAGSPDGELQAAN